MGEHRTQPVHSTPTLRPGRWLAWSTLMKYVNSEPTKTGAPKRRKKVDGI
jgi:hypothetical protein